MGADPTALLRAWGRGDQAALNELIPLVHQELRRLAHLYMAGERTGHTLLLAGPSPSRQVSVQTKKE